MSENQDQRKREEIEKSSNNSDSDEEQQRRPLLPHSNELKIMAENNEQPDNKENDEGTAEEHSRPELRRVSSYYTPYLEDRLRRKLKFYFMGPHEKFKAKKKCPWKMLLQILKIIIVTIQLVIFGYERSEFVGYVEKNNLALKHLYLKNWEPGFETMPYPPATGKYALYDIPTLVDYINNAVKKFYKTEEQALGSVKFVHNSDGTIKPMSFCSIHYLKGEIFENNNTYSLDSQTVTSCTDLILNGNDFDILDYLKNRNVSLKFDRILKIELRFHLKSYHLDIDNGLTAPECFHVKGKVVYDDSSRNGQMLIDLITTLHEFDCTGEYSFQEAESQERIKNTIFDIFVILVSVLSSILCIRSVVRGLQLQKETVTFFKKRYRKDLPTADKLEFVNFWYLMIVLNDILSVVGSSLKITIENRTKKTASCQHASSSSDNYDLCGLMLGTGNLLVWLGVLRYIGFFKTFNILVIVLKKAFPDIIRFLVCALIIYFGFMFAGWVVLGPYHIKFRHISTASECLFSLLNGDDMFVTFSATVTDNNLVWYYSRIYLYLFILLFICAVLNLFTGVILDTYEIIKDYAKDDSFPKSALDLFIEECDDPPSSHAYRREDRSCNPLSCLCCCNRSDPDRPNEHTGLLN
ncbi:mucolipin-3-like isoform X2 [Mizuhopecten yessoensis]|uniref:mucolipin-3-like isoform X2 n=1 Tax=Mizuhopecten yessoensis TaxID=6573 RepID=UPI000B459017|nr:mucolipin-3-like isoform X2 [Mizuhopecten yessoensis]